MISEPLWVRKTGSKKKKKRVGFFFFSEEGRGFFFFFFTVPHISSPPLQQAPCSPVQLPDSDCSTQIFMLMCEMDGDIGTKSLQENERRGRRLTDCSASPGEAHFSAYWAQNLKTLVQCDDLYVNCCCY